jgi:predicted nuclease of predicted toxin-antitoxin system
MLLLDQGLPRSTTLHLRVAGLKAEHVGDVGLAAADDGSILARARDHAQIVRPHTTFASRPHLNS